MFTKAEEFAALGSFLSLCMSAASSPKDTDPPLSVSASFIDSCDNNANIANNANNDDDEQKKGPLLTEISSKSET